MLEDEKLAIDESERAARHQALKGEVRREMQGEISRQANQNDEQHHAQTAAIGEHLREKAVGELVGTEAEIDRGRAAARVSQVVDYIFYLVYSLISGDQRIIQDVRSQKNDGLILSCCNWRIDWAIETPAVFA